MKKILFVSHERERNGSTVSLISLINQMKAEDDIQVSVLIPAEGEAGKAFKENDIDYHIFRYYENFRHVGRRKLIFEKVLDIINLIAVLRIKIWVKKNRIDIICSNSTAVDVGAKAALALKLPHIYYVREFMEEDFAFEYRNQKTMKKLLEGSDRVIFISHAIEHKYINKYSLINTRVIYDGVDSGKYGIFAHEILKDERLKIVQIGKLSDGKGAMDSLDLIGKVCGKRNISLTFIGDGEPEYVRGMRDYIDKNGLGETVRILPYSSDLSNVLTNSDIILMNSRAEGFGRVTVEGMLAGLLAVGRNMAGTAEIISDGENGFLFSNEIEFAEIIEKIYNNRNIYKKMALYGQKQAAERFSQSKNELMVMNCFRELF